IPEDEKISMNKKGQLVFYISSHYFENWRLRHQANIGTTFVTHGKPRPYTAKVHSNSTPAKKERAGQTVTRFDCHCRGQKFEKKGRVVGGASGKTRLRAAPFKCNCPSYFNAVYRPSTPGAKLGDTYRVEYRYNHTHELRDYSNIGTQSKSKAIKARIKSMIMRGMSISAIMAQLTVDHARFTRLMEQGETQRLSHDDFITYDDVYNILYTITSKQMRKDANPIISAQLWMEELKSQGYFTYYDQANGLYHGFSSPWQLEQLRKWGD
ncbi:hypothetical protein BGZ49_006088, partial [Haplosporangium sp. Z 27]